MARFSKNILFAALSLCYVWHTRLTWGLVFSPGPPGLPTHPLHSSTVILAEKDFLPQLEDVIGPTLRSFNSIAETMAREAEFLQSQARSLEQDGVAELARKRANLDMTLRLERNQTNSLRSQCDRLVSTFRAEKAVNLQISEQIEELKRNNTEMTKRLHVAQKKVRALSQQLPQHDRQAVEDLSADEVASGDVATASDAEITDVTVDDDSPQIDQEAPDTKNGAQALIQKGFRPRARHVKTISSPVYIGMKTPQMELSESDASVAMDADATTDEDEVSAGAGFGMLSFISVAPVKEAPPQPSSSTVSATSEGDSEAMIQQLQLLGKGIGQALDLERQMSDKFEPPFRAALAKERNAQAIVRAEISNLVRQRSFLLKDRKRLQGVLNDLLRVKRNLDSERDETQAILNKMFNNLNVLRQSLQLS